MISNHELLEYLDELLDSNAFPDFCPNGLQVEGKPLIRKLVTGVTACRELLEAAIACKADAILVHHGYFWKGEDSCIRGYKAARLKLLINNNINLFAYHLPLDCHPQLGNNAQLAKQLNIDINDRKQLDGIRDILYLGKLQQPCSAEQFSQHLETRLQHKPLSICPKATGKKTSSNIETIAWCTGAAHRYLEAAIEYGVDAYITGEAAEQTTHIAREAAINFFAAGHHATERFGVQALGQHLSETFGLEHQFIDIDNPV